MGKKFDVKGAQRDYFEGYVSTWSIYESIKRGELPAVKIGRRILLDSDDLDAWWKRQAAASIEGDHEEHHEILRRVK